MKHIILATCILLLSACHPIPEETSDQALFQSLTPAQTGIDFNNQLTVTDSVNFFTYGYFYMGGGVAMGDFNQDGLQDVYFTGNMVANKLYLNQGELKFQDITTEAGVAADDRWITGCAVVDINADGKDDIYVSVAGKWTSRKNILYINLGNDEHGIPKFEDQAEAFGLADEGGSIQTTFFDYDQDGDLDVFVANYEPTPFGYTTREYKRLIEQVTWEQSDHLYRNNGDQTFTDVTAEAGMLRFGLSIGVIANDFNHDGFTDLYVSNDFHSPDFFYLNKGDGTFEEISHQSLQHTAFYGMGIDAADYNNDGQMDFMQLDMAPADNFRSKANMASMDIPRFWEMVNNGFHYQYMYNTLQTGQGVRPDGTPFFAETAKLSRMDKTDWSWACLFADYDNDGYKDLYVTNGTRRDINNRDYFNWLERVDVSLKVKYKKLSVQELTDRMPFKKIDNPIFRNEKGQKFVQANTDWGLKYEGFSNGAAYADLDNDGDLELIVNNIDTTAAIFKNLATEQKRNNYLQIQLQGPANNPQGLGTKIELTNQGITQYHEHTTVRGFQSSVAQHIHFGLGANLQVESLRIIWPDGKTQQLKNIEANQRLQITYSDANAQNIASTPAHPVFKQLDSTTNLHFLHRENAFNDFDREVLLPHKMSAFGPALATGDVNRDGMEDIYVGGAKGQDGCLFLSENGKYNSCILIEGAENEDTNALFFDADGDGDLDLYIVSGGNEEEAGHRYYKDRFFENDGKGHLTLLNDALPLSAHSGSVVISADYDGDGDEDLFVGSRQIPGLYPSPPSSMLLENISTQSEIRFRDVTDTQAPDLQALGMVTDALWDDYDGDQDLDLIVVGEWMPVSLIENTGNHFQLAQNKHFTQTTGWWNAIAKADFDQDGDMDYVVGNLGLNYKYKASPEASFDVYAGDFDENGKQDIVLGYYQDGIQFPVRGKQCSSEQIPDLKKKFKNYDAFATAELQQIYTPTKLENSNHYQAKEFGHIYIENLGKGEFTYHRLPTSTQISSINAIEILDFNQDGNLDMVMGGNLFHAEIETPRADACYGWLLQGDGKGGFEHLSYAQSGLDIPFQTKDIRLINSRSNPLLIFANNDAPLAVFQFDDLHPLP